MTAAADLMCLGGPAVITTGRCRRAGFHASVQGVEGSDALLAARLAAGDDYASCGGWRGRSGTSG